VVFACDVLLACTGARKYRCRVKRMEAEAGKKAPESVQRRNQKINSEEIVFIGIPYVLLLLLLLYFIHIYKARQAFPVSFASPLSSDLPEKRGHPKCR
jgi:hypothetical protein